MAEEVQPAGNLLRIHGASDGEHLRRHTANRKTGASRSDQLGLRRGKNTNLFAMGFVGAPLCAEPAVSMVPRSAAPRRNAIPPGRSRLDSRTDWTLIEADVRYKKIKDFVEEVLQPSVDFIKKSRNRTALKHCNSRSVKSDIRGFFLAAV